MKNLPIHVVNFRGHQDEFLTEGMNDKKEPAWMTVDSIKRNATRVLDKMDSFKAYFTQRKREGRILPMLTLVKLQKDATAKSHRKDVRGMFDQRDKRNVIGMVSKCEVLVKIDNVYDLDVMSRNFRKYASFDTKFEIRKAIAAVTDIRLYTPEIENALDGKTIKVRLVDYMNCRYNEERDKEFNAFCNERGLNYKDVHYSDRIKIYRIDSATEKVIAELTTMDSVISIREMPYVQLSTSPEPADTNIDIKTPNPNTEYSVVGLLDSGVAKIPHLESWIQEDNIAVLDEADVTPDHGTFVAGVLLYGDELERKEYTKSIPFKIQSCIVNSSIQRIYEDELIGLVADSINKYPDIKIWNLSQGSLFEVEDDKFSDFAIALDELQDKNQIMICKSAGNQNRPQDGNLRITQGADSVRSLVIGSIAAEKLEFCDGEVNCRSPFSRIGFGPENLIKPDLVHYGGNMSIYAGVKSFSIYGNESWRSGTSFSTPRVTALAATIAHRLGLSYNPLLVKALLIHGANYPTEVHLFGKDRLKELGYGLPQGADDVLFNNEDEFTMIFTFSIEKGKDIRAIEFPYPQCLVDDEGMYYGDVTVTMASNPILNPNEGNEYCQSDVSVLLQTYERFERYELGAEGTPKTFRNEIRLKKAQNVLAKDKYSKRLAKNFDIPFTRERTLVEEFLKFQPVKKFHINLEEMTPANRLKFLTSDRKWAIKLQSLYRDSVELDMNFDGTPLITKVALVVTIKDTKRKGLVYNQGVELLRRYNYEYNTLSLHQHVGI